MKFEYVAECENIRLFKDGVVLCYRKYYALLELKLLKMLKIFVKEKNLHLNIGLSFQFYILKQIIVSLIF